MEWFWVAFVINLDGIVKCRDGKSQVYFNERSLRIFTPIGML